MLAPDADPFDQLGDMDDETLLAAVRNGDRAALGALFERCWPRALVIAGAYVRDGDQASECVAESFARVIDAIDAGGGPTVHFDRYLATTVRNMALEHIRRSSRSVLVDDVCALAAHGPVEHEPHQQVIGDLVGRAFDRLSESWREVLWLTEVEGYTVTELADSWGMTPNAVAARAYRAREALREGVLAD